MTLSTSSFTKTAVGLFLLLTALPGWPADEKAPTGAEAVSSLVVAVWPVYNLSAGPAPLDPIRRSIIQRLKMQGVSLLDEETLQGFVRRERLRFAGGLDIDTSRRLKTDTNSQAVLITVLEHYNTVAPPKVALSARLVASEDPMRTLWMTGVGMAGDDAAGLLELNLIEDPQKLLDRALDRLTASLASHLSGVADPEAARKSGARFRPDMSFIPLILSPNRKYTVAVLPFFNHSYRKHAGEILGLHFVDSLRKVENFTVVEPGEVRQALLRSRVVMYDGISLSDAGAVFGRLDVDLILTGQVFDYADYQGRSGAPRVGFSAEIIERHTREVVWLTRSHHTGDEGVYFFDWGKVRTAHVLAARMVHAAVGTLQR